ncbi:MAG: hypothetical protein CM15mP115_09030 [Alphaproteobacteria bacterium]|nr:MAG: hypothetical protein CM15mP115_09030 [Alphaproteobacteria bacterium]
MARQPQLYLDNNATTPLRPDAVSAMQLAMGPPSNPSSVHGYGRAARMIVEEARAEIAMLAGCRGADLVFTSGGTEANNLALSMFDTIITSAVEHDSVMQAAPDAKRISRSIPKDASILPRSARCLPTLMMRPDREPWYR